MAGHPAILIFVMGLAFFALAQTAQSVTLAWNPTPGTNVAGYMIHYGSNGTNYNQQADAGNHTNWSVTGLQGDVTNYFAVAAYDANHIESPLSSPVEYAVPPQGTVLLQPAGPPALATVPDQSINVGSVLIVTNTAIETNVPARQVAFSLGAGAPAGASISDDGIFRWAPVGQQGSTTNLITVWAVDNGRPALSNSVSFNVMVGACAQVTVGSSTVLIGNETSVPVYLYSTVSLTNINFSLATLAGRFAKWKFTAANPGAATATVQAADPSHPQFNLAVPGGRTPVGASWIGTISVQSLAAGRSAFAPLTVNNIVATASENTQVGSVSASSGRVALIAAQPLLEASFINRASPVLTLYGNPGSTYTVLSATSLAAPVTWTPFTNFTLTAPVQSIPLDASANQMEVFSAAQL